MGRLFRCTVGDEHFITIEPDENGAFFVIEDFWRNSSIWKRIKFALSALWFGLGYYSEVILSKEQARDLAVYLLQQTSGIVHDTPQDELDHWLLGA